MSTNTPLEEGVISDFAEPDFQAPGGGLPPDSWTSAIRSAGERAAMVPPREILEAYGSLVRCLNEMAIPYICRAFHELGLFKTPDSALSPDELCAIGTIAPLYRKLANRWLDAAADTGILERAGDRYTACSRLPLEAVDALWQGARTYADRAGLPSAALDYFEASGESLSQLVTGRTHPLSLLFPDGDSSQAEQCYEHTLLGLSYLNAILAAAIRTVAEEVPPRHTLRVLEVGAGVGSTTRTALAELPHRRIEYMYTDVSRYFLEVGQRRFRDMEFVDYTLLDIGKDPIEQGFTRSSYDILVANNVLHVAPSIADAVRRLRPLLSKNAIILLVEGTRNDPFHMFTLQAIQGLNEFQDERMVQNAPLLSPRRWTRVLLDTCCDRAVTLPSANSPAEVFGAHVIAGRVGRPAS